MDQKGKGKNMSHVLHRNFTEDPPIATGSGCASILSLASSFIDMSSGAGVTGLEIGRAHV